MNPNRGRDIHEYSRNTVSSRGRNLPNSYFLLRAKLVSTTCVQQIHCALSNGLKQSLPFCPLDTETVRAISPCKGAVMLHTHLRPSPSLSRYSSLTSLRKGPADLTTTKRTALFLVGVKQGRELQTTCQQSRYQNGRDVRKTNITANLLSRAVCSSQNPVGHARTLD